MFYFSSWKYSAVGSCRVSYFWGVKKIVNICPIYFGPIHLYFSLSVMTDEVESFLKILMINCSSVLHLQLSRKWQLPFFKNLVSDAIYLELFLCHWIIMNFSIIMETKCIWTLDNSVAEQPAENILQNPYYTTVGRYVSPLWKIFQKKIQLCFIYQMILNPNESFKKFFSHFVTLSGSIRSLVYTFLVYQKNMYM